MKSILKRVLFGLVASILIHSTCWSQQIFVKFKNEDKEYALNNDFEIFFVIADSMQKTIIKPRVQKNNFQAPDLKGYTEGHIVFKYGKLVLDLGQQGIVFDQSYELQIGYDKKPYEEDYWLKELHSSDVVATSYIRFSPLEHGDGVERFTFIHDVKAYLNESKKLIE